MVAALCEQKYCTVFRKLWLCLCPSFLRIIADPKHVTTIWYLIVDFVNRNHSIGNQFVVFAAVIEPTDYSYHHSEAEANERHSSIHHTRRHTMRHICVPFSVYNNLLSLQLSYVISPLRFSLSCSHFQFSRQWPRRAHISHNISHPFGNTNKYIILRT